MNLNLLFLLSDESEKDLKEFHLQLLKGRFVGRQKCRLVKEFFLATSEKVLQFSDVRKGKFYLLTPHGVRRFHISDEILLEKDLGTGMITAGMAMVPGDRHLYLRRGKDMSSLSVGPPSYFNRSPNFLFPNRTRCWFPDQHLVKLPAPARMALAPKERVAALLRAEMILSKAESLMKFYCNVYHREDPRHEFVLGTTRSTLLGSCTEVDHFIRFSDEDLTGSLGERFGAYLPRALWASPDTLPCVEVSGMKLYPRDPSEFRALVFQQMRPGKKNSFGESLFSLHAPGSEPAERTEIRL